MIKKVFRLLLRVFAHVITSFIYFFSGFYPRKDNIVMFGCWDGKYFRGNAKYQYLFFRDNYSNIQSIWQTKNYDLYIKLRQQGVNSCYAYSLKGIILNLKAKYFVVTHGIRDVNEYFSRNGILINLEHTTYPIKSLLMDPPSESIIKKIHRYLVNPYGYLIKPDYAITSSQFTTISTQTHFKIDTKKIIPLGKPKSDILFLNINGGDNSFEDNECQKYFDANKIRILFLPTSRSNASFSVFDLDFNYQEVDDFLNSANAILGFNFHPATANKDIKVDLSACKNIKIFNSYGDEMNRLLSRTDILITDYSSLFSDYLIYNKPIVFAKINHQSYLKEKELSLDYDKDLPGPKVKNWHDLLETLNDILIHGCDKHKNDRNEMINNIYPNLDGQARERIAKFIMSI